MRNPLYVMPICFVILLLVGGTAAWSVIRRIKRRPYTVTATHTEVETPDATLLARAAAIVEEKMADTEFSVEQLAAEMRMSRSNLFRRLKALTGQPPLEFIQQLRLQRSRQLIEAGTPVAQTAYTVGLSPRTLSMLYKKQFGTPPSKANAKE